MNLFALPDYLQQAVEESQPVGLTLREHYAGLAMQGLMTSSTFNRSNSDLEKVASCSIRMADALIAALEGENNE